jgi:hypothetical protein
MSTLSISGMFLLGVVSGWMSFGIRLQSPISLRKILMPALLILLALVTLSAIVLLSGFFIGLCAAKIFRDWVVRAESAAAQLFSGSIEHG